MATYRIRFHEKARKEWNKLNQELQNQFQNKLAERADYPRVPAAALRGMPDCYKIKLRDAGYRLVYRVEDDIVFVTVIAIGRRDKNKIYEEARGRLS